MVTPTPQADQPQDHKRTARTPAQPDTRRPWQTPRLERADLSATQFGGIFVFDGSDFDLTSFP